MGQMLFTLFVNRFATIAVITGILLPPDAQNPHVKAGIVLMFCGAVFWSMGDICLLQIQKAATPTGERER